MRSAVTKGLRFINRSKALINIARHSEIMEDAIDRIIIKEAKDDPKTPWEEVKKKLDKKHGLNDISNSNAKKSRKKSAKGR